MTQETQETIKFARHWLEIADKHGDPNAPTTGCMTALAKAVVALAEELQGVARANMDNLEALDHQEFLLDKANAELAALKERYRWQRRNEEPAPNDETPIICLLKNDEIGCTWHAIIQGRFINQFEEPRKNTFFWRPLDLPETEEAK